MKKKKKIFSSLLCAVLVVSAVGILPVFSAEIFLGDINGDCKITSADARLALRGAARLEKLSESAFLAADCNYDGKLTASDARKILRVSAKIEVFEDKESTTENETESSVNTTEFILPETTTRELSTVQNGQLAVNEVCPYCGSSDCDTIVFDEKLGVKVFDSSKAELCPEYEKETETIQETTQENINEACPVCGFFEGHLPECPYYSMTSDPVYYCQTCGLPVGLEKGNCDKFVADTYCPVCGEYCKAWECHHCEGS